jgi:hypothetical protein
MELATQQLNVQIEVDLLQEIVHQGKILKIKGVQSRNKCSLWNVERAFWTHSRQMAKASSKKNRTFDF